MNQPIQAAIENICDHLSERTACLFLGAGINFGITNNAGQHCPLGNELASWISRDLLGEETASLSLQDAAEFTRHKLGTSALNNFIYEKLESFNPGQPT